MISQLVRDVRNLPSDLAVGWRTDGRSGLRAMLPIGRVYIRQRFLVIEQSLWDARDVVPPPGVKIERIGEDCSSLRSILRSRRLALFERRLAAGRICLIARRDEQAVGYGWISKRMEPEIERLPLALPADAAYLWDLFVVRDERGSGIGSALGSARMDVARRLGYGLGWRAVFLRNKPSLRAAEKTGKVRIVGELACVRILGRLHAGRSATANNPFWRTDVLHGLRASRRLPSGTGSPS